jgi:nitrite reductase/ring-hydroxylating ferredoxin subunit/uncharacterized membrane protein
MERSTMPIGPSSLLERIENLEVLDRVVNVAQRAVRTALPRGRIRDGLHGVWLGHALHPALVQLPIGAFLSAGVLDATGSERQARMLIGVGLAGAVPAAAAGAADWSEQHEQQMRVGLVHWAGNITALGLYAGSLIARGQGHPGLGKALGFAGLTVVSGSGVIGGHLAFRQAAGANHTEQVPHLIEPGWQPLGPLSDFPEATPVRSAIDDVPLVVVRRGHTVRVLAGQCSHLAGPLPDGELRDIGGVLCIECPWHHSTFRLDDGTVVHGPATSPQPAFATRVTDDQVEIMLPGAG